MALPGTLRLLLAVVGWSSSATVPPQHEDLSGATVTAAAGAGRHTADWLCSEVNSRQRLGDAVQGWRWAESSGGSTPRIALAVVPPARRADTSSACGGLPGSPGSFLLHATARPAGVSVLATDEAGLRSGGLRLLRELHLPARPGADVGHTAASGTY